MSAGPATPEGQNAPEIRPSVKGCGQLLIAAALAPVLGLVALGGFLLYHDWRARAVAEGSRARVVVGNTLGEAILASESAAASLRCFQASCVTPSDVLFAHRAESGLRAYDGRVLAPVEDRQEWRARLLTLDTAGRRTSAWPCGSRPWMAFFLDLDDAGRVRHVGPLRISGD